MHSPSGHTSLSTLIYGAITFVAATAWPVMRSALVVCGGTGLILAIGVTRLLLDAHSVAEVSLGLVIGAGSLTAFIQKYRQVPSLRVWPLLIAAVVLASILHGHELYTEQFLHRIAGHVSIHCR